VIETPFLQNTFDEIFPKDPVKLPEMFETI